MAAPAESEKLSVNWWDKVWAEGQTGWKKFEDEAWPFEKNLKLCGASLDGAGKTALVPLCGDSAVVPFLLMKGYNVIGVEGSSVACRAMEKRVAEVAGSEGEAVRARLTMVEGDFFTEMAAKVADGSVDLVYDRASFVAISPDSREQYVALVARAAKPGALMFFEGILRNPAYTGPAHVAETAVGTTPTPLPNVERGPPHHTLPDVVKALYEPHGWTFTLHDESIAAAAALPEQAPIAFWCCGASKSQ